MKKKLQLLKNEIKQCIKVLTVALVIILTGNVATGQVILYEDFENGGDLPTNWTQIYEDGSHDWIVKDGDDGSLSAYEGSYNAAFTHQSRGDVTKLVTPAIDLSSYDNPELTFWHAQAIWSSDQDTLRVYYKTSSGGSWTLISGAEWTDNIDTWTKDTLSLPNKSSDYYIAFEATDGYGYGVVIDEVKVTNVDPNAPGEPSNPDPADNEVDVAHEGTFTWDFGANSETYDVWFGLTGNMTEVVSGASVSGGSGSYSYAGLESDTTYEWQIIVHNADTSTLNGPVWSFTSAKFSGGSGTESNPYKISTLSDLIKLTNTPEVWIFGDNYDAYQYHFIQTVDIIFNSDPTHVDWDGDGSATWDAEDQKGFYPIGNSSEDWPYYFEGVYDGQGHKIENLYIDRPSSDYIGLFGYIDNATIKNLGLINVNVTGDNNTGALAGRLAYNNGSFTDGIISNCYSTGSVTGNGSNIGGLVGSSIDYSYLSVTDGKVEIRDSHSACNVEVTGMDRDNIGGLVGKNEVNQSGSAIISNCYSTGNVESFDNSDNTGGLVGANINDATITDCYSESDVTTNTGSNVGGLVGLNQENSTVSNSQSFGSIDGNSKTGGIVGYNNDASTINNCYNTGSVTPGGGVVGENRANSTVSNSYNTGDVTGSGSGGVAGKNTASTITSCFSVGNVEGNMSVGGFVGYNYNGGEINNCYSTGNVTLLDHTTGTTIGGFCADNENSTIENCYSTGSVFYEDYTDPTDQGFLGDEDTYSGGTNTYSNNFFDSEASNQNTDALGAATPKTTAEMQTQSTFTDAGWDFAGETTNGSEDIWDISDAANNGYPRLSWQAVVFDTDQNWTGTDQTDSVVIAGALITVSGTKANEECNSLTILPDGRLTVETGGSLTVHDKVTIKADSSGTGSLIDNGTLTVSGSSTVQQYLPDGRWWYISPQISNANTDDLQVDGSDYRLFYWNEDNSGSSGWTELSAATAINTLTGYAYYQQSGGPVTAEFSGDLNTGSIGSTNNLTRSSGAYKEGFNLVGNPYPSAIDWGTENNSTTGLTKDNLENTIWVRKDGTFATYNWSGNGAGVNGGSRHIAPGQAFWVRVNEASTAGTFSVTNDVRTHSTNSLMKVYRNNLLRIAVRKGQYSDETALGFYPEATESYDKYDAEKMFATDENYPQVYTLTGNRKLAISGLPVIEDQTVLPLAFKTEKTGLHTLNFTNITEFDPTLNVFLKDNQTGELVDVRKQPVYEFYSDVTNTASRFSIIISKLSTGIETIINTMDIYTANNELIINAAANMQATLNIYNVAGKIVKSLQVKLNPGVNRIELNQPGGMYLVHIRNNNMNHTQKIVIW